ncbi:hypothetical protein, partial [Chryseobacterium sp. VAUSW3]|uniref:hypothetical protein n=1 Tax=Chryseobacterium sp. VAUSW3 TaxID=2010998 RepID=UPI001E58D132
SFHLARTSPILFPLAVIVKTYRIKMKSLIKIALLFLFSVNCSAQDISEKPNLIGNWIWTDYWQNSSDFILSYDNYVSMSINGEFIDGKNFIVRGGINNGQKAELKYSINYEKNPIEIDFIAIKDNEEKGRILGAIKQINENEFLMTMSFDGKRDLNFTDENAEKIMSIKRKK